MVSDVAIVALGIVIFAVDGLVAFEVIVVDEVAAADF